MNLTPRSVRGIRIFVRLTILALLAFSVACGFAAGGTGKTTSPSALAFTDNALPSGFVGASYSQHVSVAGGVSPYSFVVSSGALPAGVKLGAAGLIAGTPTSAEQSTFQLQVTDSSLQHETVARSFSLTIARPTVTIVTASLPNGEAGAPYWMLLAASGGVSPYSWSLTSGALPAGLTLAGEGTLTGIPTTSGSSTFTVRVQDSSSPKLAATQSYTIVIAKAIAPLVIGTTSLPNGTKGAAYDSTISVSGGEAPYSWVLSAGTLPAGLRLNNDGTISGTPTGAGQSTFTIEVWDSSWPQLTASHAYTVDIGVVNALGITTTSLPSGTKGTEYDSKISARGGKTPYSWTISSGTLPAGLSLNNNGTLSGTPTGTGQSTFTVHVSDSSSPKLTASHAYSVNIARLTPLSITTSSLPGGTKGTAYDSMISATGGKTPYSWTVSSGTLPAGLSLNNGGVVLGTPTGTGQSTFTVHVSDSSSPKLTASHTYTVTIAVLTTLSITTSSLPGGTNGKAYASAISASGGKEPYFWTISSGTLPAGLSLNNNGGISGTPTGTGQSTFTVHVSDSSSPKLTASREYSVNIAPSVLSITTSALSNGTLGAPYAATVSHSGGTPAFSWSISSGNLPAGLSLAATSGTISGTPSQTGKYTFTLQVMDSSSPQHSADRAFTINVTNSTIDQYGGLTTMQSPNQATTYFRTEKFGNKWMFVDPANNGFFMIGMYVLDEDPSVDDMHSSYYARTNAKYGDTGPTWGPAQLRRIQAWGFNSVGPYGNNYVLPVTTDYRWPGDQSNPVKVPFVGLLRPAYYGMVNENNWAPQPIKNMMYSITPYYTGYDPSNGVADYYDSNLDTFFTNELNNDSYSQAIKFSPYKQYMIGMSVDDGDEMYGFGKGPDFGGGYNNSHLGWLVLTMSPVQTANPNKGFVYSDTLVHSKQALHDQLVATYGTISALNSAWGSNYTTFGSSGNIVTADVVGTGNGSTMTFSKTLSAAAVSKYSLQILVAGQPVGGDTGNGQLWGPHVSGSINYSTGALTINFAAGHVPANSAAITANYVQNGWGIGTGLMDEDARSSHRGWVGIDYTFMSDVNSTVKADLDNYLYQIAAHYFSMCKSGIQNWIPGMMYFGPDTLGTWGAPSNRNVLKAAAKYLDVVAMGGGWPLNQSMLDFMYTYLGDKPFYFGEFRTANADSAFFRYGASVSQTDFSTQGGRGQDYAKTVMTYPNLTYSANGSRPYVGILWWQYLDNWGEKDDWGIVSLSDNAYDGKEAVRGSVGAGVRSVPCSAPLGNYLCGGEERDYGDVITPITNAHQQIRQAVQH